MRYYSILTVIFILGIIHFVKAQPSDNSGPNIILIVADDLGWKDVGCNGSQYYETPNIDRLSQQGIIFTEAYANAPICGPSRAVLMTGQYSTRTGFYTNGSSARGKSALRKVIPTPNKDSIKKENVTIADFLKTVGYSTAIIGKWHLGNVGPTKQGFDINVGSNAGKPKSYFSPYHDPLLKDGPKGEYLTDRLTNEAISIIKKFNRSDGNRNPFFMYLAYHSPHTPIQAKPEYIEHFIPKTASNGQFDPIYADMIKSLDDGVGKVMETLKDLHIRDSILVIFTSDNGGIHAATSNFPLRGYKGTLYEGGIRIPFIVRWPSKIEAGAVSNEHIMLADLFPTFRQITRGKIPKEHILDGESMLPLFFQKGSFKEQTIYWHFPAYLQAVYGLNKHWRTTPVSVVRKGKYKLMEFLEDGHLELYDLQNNISESSSQNVTNELPQKTQELKELLYSWRDKMNVSQTLKKNPEFNLKARQGPPREVSPRRFIYISY